MKISLAVQSSAQGWWFNFGFLVLISATVQAVDVNGVIVCGCCGGVWLEQEV